MSLGRNLVLSVAGTLTAAALPAQTKQPAGPPRRAHHALAYDAARGHVILTGGSTPTNGGQGFTFFNDLWSFDGKRWTALPSSGQPLSGIRLDFDTRRQRLVSFGGFDGAPHGDVRLLEGDTWRTIGQHADMPAAEPGFVYDAKRNRFVAFGGSRSQGQLYGDTWEFDGTTWTKLTISGPPKRQAHVMVYDERRGRTVVFGGMGDREPNKPPPPLGDIWEFDGTRWTERRASGPTPRSGAGAAYDAKRGMVVIFGGVTSAGFSGETWGWDGATWKKLSATGPEPRGMGYMAYDKQRDRVVMFGGRKGWPNGDLNDTWEWNGRSWRRVND
jgi:hypothetical protein